MGVLHAKRQALDGYVAVVFSDSHSQLPVQAPHLRRRTPFSYTWRGAAVTLKRSASRYDGDDQRHCCMGPAVDGATLGQPV